MQSATNQRLVDDGRRWSYDGLWWSAIGFGGFQQSPITIVGDWSDLTSGRPNQNLKKLAFYRRPTLNKCVCYVVDKVGIIELRGKQNAIMYISIERWYIGLCFIINLLEQDRVVTCLGGKNMGLRLILTVYAATSLRKVLQTSQMSMTFK